MNTRKNRSATLALMLLPAICALENPLQADELSELYLNSTENDADSTIGPNIMIILDTSGSMVKHDLDFRVDPAKYWNAPYSNDIAYEGPCDPAKVYRRQITSDRNGDGTINDADARSDEDFQSCSSSSWFPLSAIACHRVLTNGFAVDRFGEYRPSDQEWRNFSSAYNGTATVDGVTVWRECATDIGVHGAPDDTASIDRWPTENDTANPGWTSSSVGAKSFSGFNYQVVATGNYINYFNWAQTRLAAVQAALREVVSGLPPSTNLAVMRFDVKVEDPPLREGSSDGGYVIQEFVELGENSIDENGNVVLSENRQTVIDRIFAIDPAGHGGTPLGETLFEALQVFRGGSVTFGGRTQRWLIDRSVFPWDELPGRDDNTTSHVEDASVDASRNPSNTNLYASPIRFACQNNAVIFLSDGDPEGDTRTDDYFRDLPNADAYGASSCSSGCLVEVADYMASEDLWGTEADGRQTVTTHTVGFGDDISETGTALLTATAEQGGGAYTHATSYEDLKNAFQVIFRQELAKNASLSSPAVTVNAFNRLSHQDSLYFTMFDPIYDSLHWPGNVKKYKLKKQPDGQYRIVDARDKPALLDHDSDVLYDALSYWTDTSDPAIVANGGHDGNKTELGGAAAGIPEAADRTVFTWLGEGAGRALVAPTNHFRATNSGITNVMLGLPEDASSALRNDVINYMRGADLHDEDADGSTTDSRRAMGAAPHGVPAVVTYGSDEDSATQVIYAPTNDGFLHAIDAESGAELWAFVAPEALHNAAGMHQPPNPTFIAYGLDGSVIAHTEDVGGADRKWLFFGMRRGGTALYALDVTNKHAPQVLWRINGGVTPGFEQLAQTWSEPRVARIKVGGTAKPVLIFGGGYDAVTQDSDAADSTYVEDNVGRSVFIVDAETGALLWRAGADGDADLMIADMKNSIPASVEIKDKNDDGLHDLIYAADLGGRVFRFDIDNASSSLRVTGGMIASLGAHGSSGEGLTHNRKFFNRPDVVLVARDGMSYWAINIGSGDRERPKSNTTTENYLFSIKDRNVFSAPSSYGYGITFNSLYDATSNAAQQGDDQAAALAALRASPGWKVLLARDGEKALAQAKTFDYRVFFTTFDPIPLDSSDCQSDPGTARLYSLDLLTAGAVTDSNNDGIVDSEDRDTVLTHGTVPPALTFMFMPNEDGGTDITTQNGRTDDKAPLPPGGAVRRTSWNVEGGDEAEQ